MRFIPLEFIVINTPLPPTAARARLAATVDVEPHGKSDGAPGALRGTVGLAAFMLHRRTRRPRLLMPEFRGRIEPRVGGARLTGMVSLEPAPVLVLAVGALAAFWAGAGTLVEAFMGASFRPLRLAPLVAVVLAWIFAVRDVASEARRLRRLVRSALALPPGTGSLRGSE